MADSRRYGSFQPLNLEQILQEAQQRWLRPTEICEILRNHQKFQLTPEPPNRPPAGSLFLFDRKVLRYFRKDGHNWRKKKDGKTIKEAHEKLKAGSVDVLHCYYAHGEDNENFQRRSYWMLDEQLENIVLVHYREVKEGSKFGVSRLLNAASGSQLGSPQTSSAPCLEQTSSPVPTVQTSHGSSPNAVDWNEQTSYASSPNWTEQPISGFEGRDSGDSGEDPGTSSLALTVGGSVSHNASLFAEKTTASGLLELSRGHLDPGFLRADFNCGAGSSLWANIHGSSGNSNQMQDQKFYYGQRNAADFLTHKLIDAKLEGDNTVQDVVTCGDMLIPDGQRVAQELDFHSLQPHYQTHSSFQAKPPSTAKVDAPVVRARNDEAVELKKLDSFGRWMNKEMGGDCDDSLMAPDSRNYWDMLDTENDKEVSSLSRHLRLSIESMGPSLSQEQLFSICDFAPDWAYSGVETKVLITGTFLGDNKHCSSFKWSCMFGEIEVTADVLADNVIRCQVPFHASGRVPLYITCSNRLACSEVREFEYREKPPEAASSVNIKIKPEDEVQFQIRLAKMLAIGTEKKWLNCSAVGCDKCELKKNIGSLKANSNILSGMIQNDITFFEGHNVSHGDVLIENLLKVNLYEWIICKVHEGGKGLHILDSEGQGVIHLAAALGFQWVMDPIVAAGVSPNFRDVRGKTALHWASYYGREETVIALMRLGAAVGAVDDPTSASPGGQTAADLASSRGHKGIAGYLAEADLTSHLSCLTIGGNSMESAAASIEAEKALETAAQNVLAPGRAIDEQRSLRGSLAAVRTSAHAAALIQAAFRARSFRHRQLAKSNNDTSKAPLDLVALGLLNKGRRVTHFEDYLHSAAIKIQQKYSGWKGRKDFLKIRNRIVKIQAHVRGHQVRKQYKKVVWSVSIVEKAILRWRRKGHGLQGFRTEKTIGNVLPDSEKNDEYEFLRIGRKQKIAGVEKALARVQSMVRHPEARDQYMRLVSKYENSELSKEAESASLQADTTKEKGKKRG